MSTTALSFKHYYGRLPKIAKIAIYFTAGCVAGLAMHYSGVITSVLACN